jgi:bifunctional non-homologous end joining protein LigD
MLLRLRDLGRRGVAFRDRAAAYIAGRPKSGGPLLVLTFYATCSCLAVQVKKGRRTVGLALLEGRRRRIVGRVCVPPGRPLPAAGQVVQVRYRFADSDGRLVGPLYQGPRDDVDPAACVWGQLRSAARVAPQL